ncbi:MAG: hypothetical protein R6V53_00520 [Candidatus Woesearchaeota archaeon]
MIPPDPRSYQNQQVNVKQSNQPNPVPPNPYDPNQGYNQYNNPGQANYPQGYQQYNEYNPANQGGNYPNQPYPNQAYPNQAYPNQAYQANGNQPSDQQPKPRHGYRRLKHWFEDIFVIALILLNIFDFLEILGGELDFFKKILSWVMLGYLMYHVNLAKIIFGKNMHEDIHGHKIGFKPRDIDLLIILSYFLLIFKNMTHFAHVAIEEEVAPFVQVILEGLVQHSMQINGATFFFGGLLLFFIALFMSIRYDIKAPSIMSILHEEGGPSSSLGQILKRFVTSFVILCGFYVVVFNFFMEWLAFAVDAPLLVFGLFFYVFLIVRMRKHLDAESFLHKVGSFGEGFYEKFLELFYTKKGLVLGVTGMLVLHLLTDIGNFLMPYILGFHDALYFSSLSEAAHQPFITLLSEQLSGLGFADAAGVVMIYLLNIIGAFLLFLAPGYFWLKAYRRERPHVPVWLLGVFFMCVVVMILSPVLTMTSISGSVLTGVDIQTHKAEPVFPYLVVVLIGAGAGIVMGILGYLSRQGIMALGITFVNVFFFWYVKLFAFDLGRQYMNMLGSLLSQGTVVSYVSYFYLLVFMGITILFYFAGFIMYAWESYSVNYLNGGSDMIDR